MKQKFFIFLILFILGCAKIKVETTKPIDINVRLDIYQHVVKDVESIEDDIYSGKEKKMNAIFNFWLGKVYAEDSGEVDSAKERRKTRISTIEDYFQKEYIGENREAYLEIISKDLSQDIKGEVEHAVKEENADREIIYEATAKKNGVDISSVKKIFFDDHYKRASNGYWFEVFNSETGGYNWQKK